MGTMVKAGKLFWLLLQSMWEKMLADFGGRSGEGERDAKDSSSALFDVALA